MPDYTPYKERYQSQIPAIAPISNCITDYAVCDYCSNLSHRLRSDYYAPYVALCEFFEHKKEINIYEFTRYVFNNTKYESMCDFMKKEDIPEIDFHKYLFANGYIFEKGVLWGLIKL